MSHAPIEDDTRRLPATTAPRSFDRPAGRPFRRISPSGAVAERVALGMIARHGADAAREATIHLNRMIDRGDLAARDLWACVVHVIHERR